MRPKPSYCIQTSKGVVHFQKSLDFGTFHMRLLGVGNVLDHLPSNPHTLSAKVTSDPRLIRQLFLNHGKQFKFEQI